MEYEKYSCSHLEWFDTSLHMPVPDRNWGSYEKYCEGTPYVTSFSYRVLNTSAVAS